MKNTFRKTMSTNMRNNVLNEIMSEITFAYAHSKYNKKQTLLINLPVFVYENKNIKFFVEKVLKDSNITIRWGKVDYYESDFRIKATIRLPENFFEISGSSRREKQKWGN